MLATAINVETSWLESYSFPEWNNNKIVEASTKN